MDLHVDGTIIPEAAAVALSKVKNRVDELFTSSR